MTTNALDALYGSTAASTGAAGGGATTNDAGSADRFLKMLVAQMQNQDPLNPMDNAQVTSQMAQINTVAGIDKLNTTVQALNGQFVQMQALQGASLVGHDVTVAGNRFAAVGDHAEAAFELDGPADAVKVEVLNAAGRVVDTIDLGALSAGRHGFDWPNAQGLDPAACTFRVGARLGAATVGATPLMRDRVDAVSNGGAGLTLELEHSGSVAYADVKAIN